MQTEREAVTEVQTKCRHLSFESDIGALRQLLGGFIGAETGLQHCDRVVHPLACTLVGILLRHSRTSDGKRSVVARAIADERMDDIEVRRIAGTNQSVCEVVRMRTT